METVRPLTDSPPLPLPPLVVPGRLEFEKAANHFLYYRMLWEFLGVMHSILLGTRPRLEQEHRDEGDGGGLRMGALRADRLERHRRAVMGQTGEARIEPDYAGLLVEGPKVMRWQAPG